MKRLVLMRHAKSDWSMSMADVQRPLNKRGRASAKAMGAWLRSRGYLPDTVLCSVAERTRETLKLLNIKASTRFEKALYLAEASEMLEVLRTAEGETVLMLGHNPGISEFASRLLVEWPAHARFHDYPTCATLVAEFDIADWNSVAFGGGHALDFAIPREVLAERAES
jgi:phosphohistidine phosphatase